ncbi:hypothetical protein XENOCAPTIV_022010, partial [Xenoophorus captivus]
VCLQVTVSVRRGSPVSSVIAVRLDSEIFLTVFAVSVTWQEAPTPIPAGPAPARFLVDSSAVENGLTHACMLQACLPGFYRVGGVLFGGNCMQCECNAHSTQCDISGVCEGCTHNTTGPHCDQCLPGFYSDPTKDDCRLCPCPLTERSNRSVSPYPKSSSDEVHQCFTA